MLTKTDLIGYINCKALGNPKAQNEQHNNAGLEIFELVGGGVIRCCRTVAEQETSAINESQSNKGKYKMKSDQIYL